MRFSLRIKKSAFRELERIPRDDRARVVHAIDGLAENPYVGKLLKGELSGLRRLRVGQYRVIFEVNEGEVLVLVARVAHRREAYR